MSNNIQNLDHTLYQNHYRLFGSEIYYYHLQGFLNIEKLGSYIIRDLTKDPKLKRNVITDRNMQLLEMKIV